MKTLQDSEIGKDLPCLHCQLIEMGEMACYQDFCPHCGRIPPNRKTYEDQYLEAQGYHRRLVVLEQEKQEKTAKQNQKDQQQLQRQYLQKQKKAPQSSILYGPQLQQQNHPDQIQIVGEKNQHCNQAEV